jgi:hypothetical protein
MKIKNLSNYNVLKKLIVKEVKEGSEKQVDEYLQMSKIHLASKILKDDNLITEEEFKQIFIQFTKLENRASRCFKYSDVAQFNEFFSNYWELHED